MDVGNREVGARRVEGSAGFASDDHALVVDMDDGNREVGARRVEGSAGFASDDHALVVDMDVGNREVGARRVGVLRDLPVTTMHSLWIWMLATVK